MSKSLKTGFGLKAKLSSVLLLFALLLSCMIPCTSAQAKTTDGFFIEITGSSVNVRQGPGTTYTVIDHAYKNRAYKYNNKSATDKYGQLWYQISYKTGDAWVSAEFSAIRHATSNKWGMITGSLVNGRSGPGTNYGHIFTPEKGQQYSYLTRGSDSNGKTWYELISGTGTERIIFWVISDYCDVNVDYI